MFEYKKKKNDNQLNNAPVNEECFRLKVLQLT